MTLSFESDLSYQQDAIGSAVDLFERQMADDSCYHYNIGEQPTSFIDGKDNRLNISHEQVLSNLQKVRDRNGIEKAGA